MSVASNPIVVIKEWDGRRIVLSNGGVVAVGIVKDDDGREFTGVRFELAGAETVRFAMSPEATTALLALLSDKEAGEAWDMPSDLAQFPAIRWCLVRDEDVEGVVEKED